jgi:hypothetical protein
LAHFFIIVNTILISFLVEAVACKLQFNNAEKKLCTTLSARGFREQSLSLVTANGQVGLVPLRLGAHSSVPTTKAKEIFSRNLAFLANKVTEMEDR